MILEHVSLVCLVQLHVLLAVGRVIAPHQILVVFLTGHISLLVGPLRAHQRRLDQLRLGSLHRLAVAKTRRYAGS